MGIQIGTFSLPELIAARAGFADVQTWLFWGFAIAFAIKVPIFPFHSWLPDAHTQAPTAGSIILAGVLLKMGTYGFVRFNLPLFPQASFDAAPFIAVLAIIGIIYGAIVSFAQTDVKKLVAYSSISHLGFVMLGIFSLNAQGISGGILQGVSHGISTGALFFLVGVIYEQRHTRLMSEFGGLWKAVPVFSVLSLIVVLSSMGLPGLNGFVGEFTILMGALGSSVLGFAFALFATFGVIMAAIYLLYMFQKVYMGPIDKEENRNLPDLHWQELAVLIPILIMIVWIGLQPGIFFDMMNVSTNQVVQLVQPAIDQASESVTGITHILTSVAP
jgi:NADH-quinone oxidoreductase subunit M